MSQRAANRSRDERLDTSALEPSIKECVRYILCREGGKAPIKHSDISKHLQTACQTASNQVSQVIIEANKALKNIYGYELIKLDTKSGKCYIVVLHEECDSILPAIVDEHHRKLLTAALTHIFMSGAPVTEDDMWKFLIKAGLMEEEDAASRKVLTTVFTKQMYLEYTKVKVSDAGSNVARSEFTWGKRAHIEVPKMFILQKMAEAFGKTPDYWCEQYKEASRNDIQYYVPL